MILWVLDLLIQIYFIFHGYSHRVVGNAYVWNFGKMSNFFLKFRFCVPYVWESCKKLLATQKYAKVLRKKILSDFNNFWRFYPRKGEGVFIRKYPLSKQNTDWGGNDLKWWRKNQKLGTLGPATTIDIPGLFWKFKLL